MVAVCIDNQRGSRYYSSFLVEYVIISCFYTKIYMCYIRYI